MLLIWALSAVLALPGRAVDFETVPQAPAGVHFEVHPLLLGALSDPTSPVTKELTARAGELAAQLKGQPLTAARAAAFLTPLWQGSAVQRPAAAILARVIAEPQSAGVVFKVAPDLRQSPLAKLKGAVALPASADRDDAGAAFLRSLARAAASEPYAKIVFDGYAPPSALYDVKMTNAGPVSNGTPLTRLGGGTFGVVHVHPQIPGAVIKTIYAPKGWGVESRRKMYEYGYKDEVTGRALAAAGAGPRVLSHTDELGSPVLIKERVYGETLHEIIAEGRYGAAEHSLVLDLIARLARARLRVDDFRDANVMIGRTDLDKTRRAYLVDGGNFLPIPAGVSERKLKGLMYREPSRWISQDAEGRAGVKSRPFNRILEEALVAGGEASWWVRLKVAARRWAGRDKTEFKPDEP